MTGTIGPSLLLCALAASAVLPGSVRAETLRIRTGEHGSFTRIVVESAARADWALGRSGGRYELRLGPAVAFDVTDAFRLIGRDRVAALSGGALPGSLLIGLGCDCHATAFATPSGALAIDVADGPATEGAPFERPLPAAQAAHPESPDAGAAPIAMEAPHPVMEAENPRLALFWRGVQLPDDGAKPVGAAERASDARSADIASAAPAIAPPERRPGAPNAPDSGTARAIMPQPAPTGGDAEPAAGTWAPEGRQSVSAAPPPDARVTGAEAELIRQLGRAASQGLVELKPDRLRRGGEAAHGTPGSVATTAPAPPLPILAETSVDRDSLSPSMKPPETPDGAACIADEVLDVAAWGDGRPFAFQIADHRTALVGEFDRPSADAVLALARLYLHFGFGAEARAVLSAFGTDPVHAAVLADMGRILDGDLPRAGGTFAGMTGCNSVAGLWAVMAQANLPPGTDVDGGAVVRAFSAMPPHLRRQLGPGLVERLLSAGAADAARSVRDAIARAPGDDGHALDIALARIDRASGDAGAGQDRLDRLAQANDPLSAEALILTIDARLRRGGAVEPSLADAAEALAFEQQDGVNGPVLASLHILARASTGEFGRAFDAFRNWPGRPSDMLRSETAARLFAMLAAKADERALLTLHFGARDLFDAAAPDTLLRLDLAERLAAAGFVGEARRVLKGDAALTDRGRRILARAALDEFEPNQALATIAGLADAEADRIRAEALAMRGEHSAAAARFRALGDVEQAGREDWRAGDAREIAATGPEPLRAAIAALGHGTDGESAAGEPGAADAPGPLATGRALVENSRAARAAVEALLAATPDTSPAAPGSGG